MYLVLQSSEHVAAGMLSKEGLSTMQPFLIARMASIMSQSALNEAVSALTGKAMMPSVMRKRIDFAHAFSRASENIALDNERLTAA
jgi:hypothetical protein